MIGIDRRIFRFLFSPDDPALVRGWSENFARFFRNGSVQIEVCRPACPFRRIDQKKFFPLSFQFGRFFEEGAERLVPIPEKCNPEIKNQKNGDRSEQHDFPDPFQMRFRPPFLNSC